MTTEEALKSIIEDGIELGGGDYIPFETLKATAKALEEYIELKRLEEQGLLLRLPCKVGDEVWSIRWGGNAEESVMVDGKRYFRNVYKRKVTKEKIGLYDYESIGKTVFLTREEAEAKLKELEE